MKRNDSLDSVRSQDNETISWDVKFGVSSFYELFRRTFLMNDGISDAS